MHKLKKDQLNPKARHMSDSSMSEYEAFKMNNLIQRHRRDSTSSIEDINRSQFSDSNITLFNTLLTDPSKRAKVLELLTKEGLVPNENMSKKSKKGSTNSRGRGRGLFNNYMKSGKLGVSAASSPVNQIKKRHQLESPSALHRRRALQKLESENSDAAADSTDSSMSASQDVYHGTPKPFNELLTGVVAYVEVRSSEGDRSEAIKMMMRAMGATVKDTIFRGITHVVFKDGSFRTYEKAKLVNAHLVSVLWLEATKRNKFRVPESKYPALGTAAYDYNVTTLCQSMQREYDNILKDEFKRRSTMHISRRNSDFVNSRKTMHGSESLFESNKNDSLLGEMRRIHYGDASFSSISRRNSTVASDNESNDSFLSTNSNIIPSSQNDSPFIRKPKMTSTQNQQIEPIAELTEDESLGACNIAKHIKNSFELKKSMNIRSPESLAKNKSLDISDKSSKRADDDSLKLHITTDSSNVTGNRRSSNTKSDFSNKIISTSIENLCVKPKTQRNTRKTIANDEIKSDSNLITNYFASQSSPIDPNNLTKAKQRKNQRKGIENKLKSTILSDSDSEGENAKYKAPKPKLRKSVRNTIPSFETSESELENKKENNEGTGKIRRRRTLYNVNPKNDDVGENENINTGKTIASLETSENELEKKKENDDDIRKIRKRRTLLNVNPKNDDVGENENITGKTIASLGTSENELEKKKENDGGIGKIRRRKTLFNVNPKNDDVENENVIPKKTKASLETSENEPEMKKQNEGVAKVRRRRTLYNVEPKNDGESIGNENIVLRKGNEVGLTKESVNLIEKDDILTKEDDNSTKINVLKENTNDNISVPKKPRTRKLFNINQSLSQINWDLPQVNIENEISIPVKKNKFLVDIPPDMKTPKILTKKARNYIKKSTTTDSEDKSEERKKTKTQTSKVETRKKVEKPNYETTENETESGSPEKRPKVKNIVQNLATPRRQSMRIAASKVDSSDIENIKTPAKKKGTVTPEKKTRKVISSKTPRGAPKTLKGSKVSPKTPKATQKMPKVTQKPTQATQTSTQNFKSRILENIADRRSTIEFVQRDPKKSPEIKLTQKPVSKLTGITCTRMHRQDVLLFEQIVKKIGGFTVEDEVSEKTTHLVAGEPSRTINMLRAIARGCWILKQEWLLKSLEAGKWLEEEEYELTEFSAAVQKCRMERQTFGPLYSMDVFKDCGNIYVSRSTTPRCSDLEELVILCGGTIVKNPRQSQIIVGEFCRHENIVCVNEKWILECISCNKKKSMKNYTMKRSSGSSTC